MSDNAVQLLSQYHVELADCLAFVAQLSESCLDLVYIDPPYFTGRHFKPAPGDGGGRNPQDPQGDEPSGFNDRWRGGREEYLAFLAPRLAAARRCLKPQGVFLLHLDWHIVHYAKVLCDGLFGEEAFQNEIIWYYQTGGASDRRFSRKHDTILFYAVGSDYYFNGRAVAIPRTPKALHRSRYSGARIAPTDTLKNPDDVITIPALNPMALERNGYPTQKPVALLEFLLSALCPPGGAVGDFFCGSGTTLIAAHRLGMPAIGCDISPAAVKLARGRIAEMASLATPQANPASTLTHEDVRCGTNPSP